MINILDLIYPPVCGICGKICKDYICNKCSLKIKEYEIKNKKIYKLQNDELYLDELFSFYKYEGVIRDTLIKYKFNNKPYLYKFFSKNILNNEKMCGFLKKYDIIIPVPISKKRKYERGYNQTELIAREIAKALNIELENKVLIKNINTKPQSELTKKERTINVKNAFKVLDIEKTEDKNILIFDDIYTTGSTANECARMLKEFKTKKVGILTIAKDYKNY